MNAAVKVLKARWVLPMCSEAISNACVIVSGKIIENVVPADQLNEFIAGRQYVLEDYAEAIILPGFINLHTHLEHTSLRSLAKEASFLDWLPTLIEATAKWSAENRAKSAQCGVEESMAAGTTFVVDTSYNGASAIPLAQSGLRAIIGLETFSLDEGSAKLQWQKWLEQRNNILSEPAIKIAQQEERLAITVSPHAPYTVCPALWQEASNWTKDNGLPILTHLAESEAEGNWFRSEDESLKQFLIYAFGKRMANFGELYEKQIAWKKPTRSPIEHLYKQGLLTDNLLAAHAVQIDDIDIGLLKSAGVAIAHCPNSNIRLKCGRAPLEKLLANNIKVGLGTDSVASSNNLDMLSEAKFAISLHKSSQSGQSKVNTDGNNFGLSARQALELITIKAAQCLRLEHKLGSLRAGNLADIAIFTLPEKQTGTENYHTNDLYTMLVEGSCRLQELLVNGKTIYGINSLRTPYMSLKGL